MTTSNPTFFDDLDSKGQFARPANPIWTIDLDDPANEKDALSWLKGELDYLTLQNDLRYRRMLRNLALYKGIQYQNQDTRTDLRDRGDNRSNVIKRIVVNHLYDLVKHRISRLLKYKPAVAILASNDEHKDKIAAKATKYLLDHIWYTNRFENEMTRQVATNAMVQGESYLFITWDPDKGDLHPEYVKAKAKYETLDQEIPLLDDGGAPRLDGQGNPIYVKKPIKTGDVKYEVVLSSEITLERKQKWEDVNYLFKRELMPVEEAKIKYPGRAADIKPSDTAQTYDYEKMQLRQTRNECVVWTFYHKRTEAMPQGRVIVFTKEAVLHNDEFPYSHYDLPCVRYTDIDLPGEVHAASFFELIKGLTGTYNNLTNLILRNQIQVAHPKWMMPVGAAKIDALGNDITIVQYKGPQPPQLVQCNPTPMEIFKFRDGLKEEFEQIAGVFGVSRGEPPPGIKAGIALQFLNEQESERHNEGVLKWNEWILKSAIMTLGVAGDYYDSTDQRMIRVLGTNNQWMTKFFDATHLSKDYDVRVQNSSAFPDSKSGRLQYLIELNQNFPGMLANEQVVEILDLAQSEKYVDLVTVTVQAAEAENEQILDNEITDQQAMPAEYEDHILHWRIHMKKIQAYAFKFQTPKEIQKKMTDHVLTHEMFMWKRAKKNPLYLQALSQLQNWPAFFVAEDLTSLSPGAPAAPGEAPQSKGFAQGGLAQPPEVQNNPQTAAIENQLTQLLAVSPAGGPIEGTH